MEIKKNIVVPGAHKKPIPIDLFYNPTEAKKSIVIFCHGYKGFKDWGAWDLMAQAFANEGFLFLKFNFSHNGGTVQQPIDFPDLEAFGNNNYTKELDDLETVINWAHETPQITSQGDLSHITLIGHSRGGGIVTIKAEEDNRITKVISLAGVSSYGKRTSTTGDLEQWKKDGVKYVLNGRTKQKMPHYYQFYEDFIANEKRLTIQRAVSNLNIPYLIIHGDSDTSVLIDEAHNLYGWSKISELKIIENANHVFGAKHPWNDETMPSHLKEAIDSMIDFIS